MELLGFLKLRGLFLGVRGQGLGLLGLLGLASWPAFRLADPFIDAGKIPRKHKPSKERARADLSHLRRRRHR